MTADGEDVRNLQELASEGDPGAMAVDGALHLSLRPCINVPGASCGVFPLKGYRRIAIRASYRKSDCGKSAVDQGGAG